MLRPQNYTIAGLALALFVLGLVNVLAYRNAARLSEEANDVARAYRAVLAMRGLLARTIDAETGQRGFVITGDERYLEPYLGAREAIAADEAALAELVHDPLQRQRLVEVAPLLDERLAQIERVIDLRRRVGFAAAADVINSDVGRTTQDSIRASLAELESRELELLQRQAESASAASFQTSGLVFISSALSFVAALLAVFAMRRHGLAAGEDRFRRALESAPLPVFIHNEDHLVLFANHAFGEATRTDPAVFRTLKGWIERSSDPAAERERLARLYAGAPSFENVERQVMLADGDERTWLVSSAALGPGRDGRRQAITMVVDLTERKRSEAALADSAARLRDLSLRLVEVQEVERRTIARELHDEIGQALTGLDLVLEMASRAPSGADREHLRAAQGYVRDLTGRVRNLSLDLRPSMLDDLGLVPALRWLFQRYTEQTRIAVDFRCHDAERRFPPAVETAAYRIIQEALTNVARYAGVGEVTVQIWVEQDRLSIQVEDAGAGFDVEAARLARRSTGLEGMRERAELTGGSVTIEAAVGQGCLVIADLPLTHLPHPTEALR